MTEVTRTLSVAHIITGLNEGGAEAVLYRLIASTAGEISHSVVSLLDEGVYGPRLRALGVRVGTLNMPRGRISLSGLWKLHRCLRAERPDIVQTWMYHANLLGGLTARLTGLGSVIWGIHHTDLDPNYNSRLTRAVARVCGPLSGWLSDAIVCCSDETLRVHERFGYRKNQLLTIPNGYDLARFRPDVTARQRVRSEWQIRNDELLFGLVARWNPQKDHANLLQALGQLATQGMAFRCVLVGPGMSWENEDLVSLADQHGMRDRLVLTGPRTDIPDVMNGLDLHILSSAGGEAFPNVVAEAMACGTPCVVTNVGDAALIVGNTGWVAEPRRPDELAKAITHAVSVIRREGRDGLGQQCRKHVKEYFSLERMVAAYTSLWDKVLRERKDGRR